MQYIYYVSFVYLDKKGKQFFGDTLYDYGDGIRTENDIKDISSMLRMHYNTNHLRILGFSLLEKTETYSKLKNFVEKVIFDFLSSSRIRQKLKAWRISKGRRKKC